ncbi:MAG: beta-hydroxyacyl-ACP dehydratase [Planctomycetales bacterium]|nr:beta-hydroxyacyl-ACP dehydratase [Planctomycetales bacterium]
MRWFWIDRFTEFVSGERASSVKCVSLVEEYVDGYFPGSPMMTPSFVIEGFAQTGGILIGQQSDFLERVVLAKIGKSKFHFYARPGDKLTYSVKLETLKSDGGLVTATSHVGDRLQAEAELTFAHVDASVRGTGTFFVPAEFLRMLRIFRLFDVGVNPDGTPIKIPQHLLDEETLDLAS